MNHRNICFLMLLVVYHISNSIRNIEYVYFLHKYPPPCRKAPLRAQAHAEGTSHYLQSSSSSSHPVLFAVGVWRSSWSWSLQFQLKSESGVPSLETSKGGPPPHIASRRVDCYHPESPNFSLWPPIFAILPHLGALGRYLGSSRRSQATFCRQVAPRWRPARPT